jgi:hypothetical protein
VAECGMSWENDRLDSSTVIASIAVAVRERRMSPGVLCSAKTLSSFVGHSALFHMRVGCEGLQRAVEHRSFLRTRPIGQPLMLR